MAEPIEDRIAAVLGERPLRVTPMNTGSLWRVARLQMSGSKSLAVKYSDDPSARLEEEAFMLRFLAERTSLPVPRVLHADASMLLMEFVESDGRFVRGVCTSTGEHLAALHEQTSARFGFDRDTNWGPVRQSNKWADTWVTFFRERRLLPMLVEGMRGGPLGRDVGKRVERLAARLDELIDEPPAASLVHGDVWPANLLVKDGRVAAFLDPALSYSDPESEVAYTMLFPSLADGLVTRYKELRPLRPGFERRSMVYNLAPLLALTSLFGKDYAVRVTDSLTRLGF